MAVGAFSRYLRFGLLNAPRVRSAMWIQVHPGICRDAAATVFTAMAFFLVHKARNQTARFLKQSLTRPGHQGR